MDGTVAAACDFWETEAREFRALARLFQHDATASDAAGFGHHFFAHGIVVGGVAQGVHVLALHQRMAEHRIEIDDVEAIIWLGAQVVDGRGVEGLDAAHGGRHRLAFAVKCRKAVRCDGGDQRALFEADDTAMLACHEARDDGIGAKAERAVEHAHARRESHGLRHVVMLSLAEILDTQMAHVRMKEQLAVRRFEHQRARFRDEDAGSIVTLAEFREGKRAARDVRNAKVLRRLLGKMGIHGVRVTARRDDGS